MTPLARAAAPFDRLTALLGRIKVNRTWLTYGGYTAFFLACFVLFALVGFPYDRLARFLEQEVARVWPAATPGGAPTRLTIGDIGPTFGLGVELENVRIEQDPPQPGRMPVAIALDALAIHPSFVSLVAGHHKVGFDATVGDGSVEGTFVASDTGWALDAELDTVDFAKLGLGGVLGVPVAGTASGRVRWAGGEEASSDEGEVTLQVDGLVLGDGKAKMPVPGMGQGLTVEPIKAGKLDLRIAIHQGIAAIEKCEANGEDIELRAGGSVRIGHPFARSRVDATIEWKFADAYKKRNDRTRAVFELMEANPLLKRATGADGTMRFALSGTPQTLNSRPAGAVGAASTRPARRSVKAKAAD
jgi:type II secretion system protein N